MPRIRPASRSGWKTSSASVFSPVPRNLTGRPVTALIESAAPPRASPSILVRMRPVTRHRGRERLGDGDGLLAGHRVDDEQRLDRLDGRVDRGDLGHQRLVDREAAGGVEDDDVAHRRRAASTPWRAMSTTRRADRGAVDRDVELLAERLELVGGGRSVRVGGDEQRPAALLDDVPRELGRRRRLARALEADERDDRRRCPSRWNVRSPRRGARSAPRGRS